MQSICIWLAAVVGVVSSQAIAITGVCTEAICPIDDDLNGLLEGNATFENFGNAIALSADGRTLVAAAARHDENGVDDVGLVAVYVRKNSNSESMAPEWSQLGGILLGSERKEFLGDSVALSSNGRILAISATGFDTYKGYVQVYEFRSTTNTWTPLGNRLVGGEESATFGSALSLSDDGLTLAVGSPDSDGLSGLVVLFSFIDGQWIKKGATIEGNFVGDGLGTSVSLSGDGNTLAIGTPYHDQKLEDYSSGDYDAGHVTIYTFSTDTGVWEQTWEVFGQRTDDSQAGHQVALSSDGLTMATSSPWRDTDEVNTGLVHVHVRNAQGVWEMKGAAIAGASQDDAAGETLSLSDDGNVLAIGAPSSADNTGSVRLFYFDKLNRNWIRIGDEIQGASSDDSFGRSISLSGDGRTVAIGASTALGAPSLNIAGRVNVFSVEIPSQAPTAMPTSTPTKSPVQSDGSELGSTGAATNTVATISTFLLAILSLLLAC